jgi:hypothetical protein
MQLSRQSVSEFRHQFVKLLKIASSFITSSPQLLRIHSKHQIELYCIGDVAETRSFLKRSAIPEVQNGDLLAPARPPELTPLRRRREVRSDLVCLPTRWGISA